MVPARPARCVAKFYAGKDRNYHQTSGATWHPPHFFVVHGAVLWLTQTPEAADQFRLHPVHNGRLGAPISRLVQIQRRGLKLADGAPD
ncbi:MAG: hypothetical protein ACLP2Y_10385 [Limisphaerales bacterium]